MNWIIDNPIPLFILGLIAQLILGVILWQSGRGWVLVLMVVLGITSFGLVIAEIAIISPTEEISDTLDAIAAALETNKPENVFAHVAPEKTLLRAEAAQQLKRVQINEAAVTGDLQVSFDSSPEAGKPTAVASFNARIKAKFLKDTSPYEQLVQRFKVYLRKENGKWLVTDYEMNRR